MYYNSNKNSNDYYNSYKKELAELEAYRKEEHIQKIMKIILALLTLLLLIAAAFYLYQYFNPSLQKLNVSSTKERVFSTSNPVVIREETLPKSIQFTQSNIPTPKPNINEKDIELIVEIIMRKMNEVEDKVFVNKNLKEINYYNEIILTDNEVKQINNDSLVELSTNLNTIISEKDNLESGIHENDMRIIIVESGDTLSTIAKRAYGNRDDYQRILMANPEMIQNPNQIFVGQRLRIPSLI